MRVIHVVPAFHPADAYGGPIEAVYQLCRELAIQGCTVRVLTTDANGSYRVLEVPKDGEVKLAEGLSVRYCRRAAYHTVSPKLLTLLPSYVSWADVVHLTAVYSFPTIPTLATCRLLRKPVVWSPHGALKRWERSTRRGAKAVWEVLCRALAPSKLVLHVSSEEEAQESLTRIPRIRAVVIPNGVEIPERLTNKQQHDVLRLVYLGRLHPIKGIENLLLACQGINTHTRLLWSLVIAGDGDPEYVDVLFRQVTKLGLAPQVAFIGAVSGETKRALFEDADIVVVPSHTESFGMVVTEALAHAVPVVASQGTPWKRIEEKGCGLWVNNAPGSLATAIRDMSRRPLREMGERGRDWMRTEFSWELQARKMADTYRKLADV